jgi:tetratricopeptide (TPR) repeat protein
MSTDTTPDDNSLESVVAQVADDFRDRQERGERPDAEEYVAGYPPQYATAIREVLAALQILHLSDRGGTMAERQTGRQAAPVTEVAGDPARAEDPGPSPGEAALPGTSADVPAATPVPGYQILGTLGRGGMGIVYKALHRPLNRVVALKMILAGAHGRPDELARFRREAELVARLRHPNIVQIYEIGEHEGLPYLSLEYVEGPSLQEKLGGCPQPAREAAQFAEVLARAMQAAHALKIIHRDLKPANVLLTADGTPKITDFGLAKRLDTGATDTQPGTVLGTANYMPPEQASGRTEEIGPLVDVYALGALLYEMLTGRPPFLGESQFRTLEQVCSQEPVPPRRLQPSVPHDLETVCLTCLRKEPRKRYASALELAEDLRRFLQGEPIRARPVPAWERSYKWARRRPAQAALVAAVVAALFAGATGTVFYGLYEGQRADHLKRQLERQETSGREWKLGLHAENAGDLEAARAHFDRARANWDPEVAPDPGDYGRIQEDYDRVVRRLKARDDRQDFDARRKRFEDYRAEVLFHQIDFLERARDENRAAIRRAAPEALKQLNLAADAPPARAAHALEAFRDHADSPKEMGRIAAECYEVLLAWAEAEAPPAVAPGGGDEAGTRRALHLLDLADALAEAHDLPTPQTFHLRRARYLDLLGDDLGAAASWEEAERGQADTALDLFLDALALYRQRQSAEAATACARVLRLEPDHFWARYLQALCYLHGKNYPSARDGLTACLVARPDFVWAWLLRATAEDQLDDFEAAEGDFNQVFQMLGQADDRLTRFVALINRGAMRTRRGTWAEAEHDLSEAIALQPDAAEGYVNLAYAYRLRQNWDAALQLLTQALNRRPEDARLYHTRAEARLARRDRAAARRDFEQAIARAPAGSRSDWLATDYVELAHLQFQDRQYDDALASCAAALGRWPDYAPAHLRRAETLLAQAKEAAHAAGTARMAPLRRAEIRRAEERYYREAGEALDRYLRRETSDAVACRTRGVIHLRLGRHREAVEAFGSALKLKPDADTLSLRGWAYLKLDAAQMALPDFEEALRLQPAHVQALCGRGYARVCLGYLKDGLEDAERALAAAPADPLLPLRTACTYGRALRHLEAQADGRPVPTRIARAYQDQAVQLVGLALKQVPQGEEHDFWQVNIENERDLGPIRQATGMHELERKYAR